MSEPRRWVLRGVWSPQPVVESGPRLMEGERVDVVEAVVTDEMMARAGEAVSRQLDRGYRGHWCAEWDDARGGCQRCNEIARAALEAALGCPTVGEAG